MVGTRGLSERIFTRSEQKYGAVCLARTPFSLYKHDICWIMYLINYETSMDVSNVKSSLHSVLGEYLLHYADFGCSGLLLVCSRADTDIRLNSNNAF